MKRNPEERGFTLIEVVVALAIVAIGMLAVFKTIGDTVNNVDELRDRSLAEWIADNRITEIRVAGDMPSVEETAGEVDYAGRKWHWITKVSQTQVKGLRRIDVSVRRDTDPDGSTIVTLAGFMGQTISSSPPSSTDWNAGGGPQDPSDQDGGDEDEEAGGDRGDEEAGGDPGGEE